MFLYRSVLVVLLFSLYSTLCFCGTIAREFSKTYDFDGSKVSIKTSNGSIYVESWDDDRVQVDAEIQVRSGSKEAARDFVSKVKVLVEQRRDELLIEVDQPQSGGAGFLDWLFGAGEPNVTVNFEIMVPRVMNVIASSVNGTVETVGLEGQAVLTSTNGKITADDIAGSIKAQTTNGSIRVDVQDVQDDDKLELRTVNGNIILMLDRDVCAYVKVSTVNGSIRTEFPLEIRGEWGPKNVSGKIGDGGAQIKLETVNGSIAIEER